MLDGAFSGLHPSHLPLQAVSSWAVSMILSFIPRTWTSSHSPGSPVMSKVQGTCATGLSQRPQGHVTGLQVTGHMTAAGQWGQPGSLVEDRKETRAEIQTLESWDRYEYQWKLWNCEGREDKGPWEECCIEGTEKAEPSKEVQTAGRNSRGQGPDVEESAHPRTEQAEGEVLTPAPALPRASGHKPVPCVYKRVPAGSSLLALTSRRSIIFESVP